MSNNANILYLPSQVTGGLSMINLTMLGINQAELYFITYVCVCVCVCVCMCLTILAFQKESQ